MSYPFHPDYLDIFLIPFFFKGFIRYQFYTKRNNNFVNSGMVIRKEYGWSKFRFRSPFLITPIRLKPTTFQYCNLTRFLSAPIYFLNLVTLKGALKYYISVSGGVQDLAKLADATYASRGEGGGQWYQSIFSEILPHFYIQNN